MAYDSETIRKNGWKRTRQKSFKATTQADSNKGSESAMEKAKADKVARVNRAINANLSKYLWTHARRRARLLNIPFTIEISDVKVPERCPMLDVVLRRGGRRNNFCAPSLDRIKNELGYVKGNVWVISRKANTIKSNASVQELISMSERLKQIDFASIIGSVILESSIEENEEAIEPFKQCPTVINTNTKSSPIGFMLLVNYQTGEHHELVFFPSRRRSDCFQVSVDGRVWNRCCGWWKILEKLVKPLKQRWVNL